MLPKATEKTVRDLALKLDEIEEERKLLNELK